MAQVVQTSETAAGQLFNSAKSISSDEELITTIFHEMWHHKQFKMDSDSLGGTEAAAETYGKKMYQECLRRSAAG